MFCEHKERAQRPYGALVTRPNHDVILCVTAAHSGVSSGSSDSAASQDARHMMCCEITRKTDVSKFENTAKNPDAAQMSRRSTFAVSALRLEQ